jgi:small GTP-binding protein
MSSPPDSSGDGDLVGTVAIVGYPNVGKSTLINRLTSTRAAVVHETSGTTRDRKELVCEWAGKRFLLVDTGGVDVTSKDAVSRSIVEQAKAAVAEADLVLLVVDARAGVMPGDEELAEILRASHKPVLVLANKIDDRPGRSRSSAPARPGRPDPALGHARPRHGRPARRDRGDPRGRGGDAAVVGDGRSASRSRAAGVGRRRLQRAHQPAAIVSGLRAQRAIDRHRARARRARRQLVDGGLRRKRRQRKGSVLLGLRALEAAERAGVIVLVDAAGVVERPRRRRRRGKHISSSSSFRSGTVRP